MQLKVIYSLRLVNDIKDLPKILHEAFHVATTGRPGPVLIDIPKDIQFAKTNYSKPKIEKKLNGSKAQHIGKALLYLCHQLKRMKKL